ncbi:SDR family NAD(P)-dependent oxidoreductase [Nitrospirillum iridis]|uniref:Probable oxidoreductase n=1 Tax=Nitrospirillum iridis TaxID=765888 RepID=A0A7X0B335_9PROT|nr:SDR family NAD(P)-dependent oxidoreductase [Nitrospirillum iridis]MBB6253329.1 NAD(P)-dependent dehydrogenase (short-subunit alcohol dehydrogenase family) [Nitrospirillum iridis]
MTTAFGATSTTADVLAGIDLTGRRALVTGVSSGLGIETARALVDHGATVVGTARDVAKARIANTVPLHLEELDLASLTSVRDCAARLAAQAPFDLIIANAGIMGPPLGRTREGFETQFATNHLGHFLLANRLAPRMRNGGRVIVLASSAHHIADIDLDDPNFQRRDYTPYAGYGGSKTANILFAVEFDRRHRNHGLRAVAVHPGGVETGLGRHMDPATRDAQRQKLTAAAGAGGWTFQRKSVAQGAATTVWAAAVAPAAEVGGQYCEDCQVAPVLPPGTVTGPMGPGVAAYAVDPARARALWRLSEELVDERFQETSPRGSMV